jgi:uncharacterized protein YkwD
MPVQRPKAQTFLLRLLLAAGLILAGSVALRSARADDPVDAPPGLTIGPQDSPLHPLGAEDREAFERQIVTLVNQERTSRGIPPLKRNDALDAAAYGHSQDMGVNDFVSHTGSDGSSPDERIRDAGYTNLDWWGENVAAGHPSPEDVMYDPEFGWMNSKDHRTNILREQFREIGVGYYYDADDTYPDGVWGYKHYWTQTFGSRSGVYPVIVNSEAYSTTSSTVELYVYGPGDAQQMRFSNDNANWSSWETYNANKTWNLAAGGSGTRTVYAQVENSSQTFAASDDIQYAPENPVLAVDPTRVTFLTEQASGVCLPSSQAVQVSNAGGSTMSWNSSESSAWFQATEGASEVTISCVAGTVAAYPAGERTDELTVTAPGAENSPQIVTVKLVVAENLLSVYLPLVAR